MTDQTTTTDTGKRNSRTILVIAAAAVAAIAVLVALAGMDRGPRHPSGAKIDPVAERENFNGRWRGVAVMWVVLEDGGYECTEKWNKHKGDSSHSYEAATCRPAVHLFDHGTNLARDRFIEQFINYDPWVRLLGRGWSVSCPDLDECRQMQAILGGDIWEGGGGVPAIPLRRG